MLKKIWNFYPVKVVLISLLGGMGIALLFPYWGEKFCLSCYLRSSLLNSFIFIVLWLSNAWAVGLVRRLIGWKERPLAAFFWNMAATLAVTIAAFTLSLLVGRRLIYNFSFRESWESLSNISYEFAIMLTLLISAIMHGRSFLLSWRSSELEAAKLREAHLASRYEALRNQVNPHFLFNSLNVLSTLVHKDADQAEHFIGELSRNLRYVLETRERELVPLSRELQAVEAYIYLSQTRYGNNLRFCLQNMPNTDQLQVAPLTLQMLVENAIKHNIISAAQPLEIQIVEEEEYLVVKNALQRRENVQGSLGVGLENIRQRYSYLSDKPVVIEEKDGFFVVKIPKIQHESSDH